jgi:hypothetical protein
VFYTFTLERLSVAAHVGRDRVVARRGERGSWWRHEYQLSGKPWQSSTTGASSAPDSARWTWMLLAATVRWGISLIEG